MMKNIHLQQPQPETPRFTDPRPRASLEDIQSAIASFKQGSAGGLNGLTPQHLKDLTSITTDDVGRRLTIKIADLVNIMLAGEINFWSEPLRPHFVSEFSVSPEDTLKLYPLFERMNIKLELLTPNIQSYLDQEIVSQYISRRTDTFNWISYYRIHDIYNWMKDLESRNRDKMKIVNLGRTYEGRDIMGVHIKFPGAYNVSRIFIEAGIHARERIAVAVATYIIYELVNAVDPQIKELSEIARKCEWYIVPSANPDGYEYTFSTDRMWRKNRRPFGTSHGVDLNRNFDVDFASTNDEKSAKNDPNSEVYPGPSAFSEAETLAISQYATNIKNIDYYLALHSYGQLGILPYSSSYQHLENYDEVYKLCVGMGQAIEKMYGTQYTCGTSYDKIGYLASGTAVDWVKRKLRVRYAMSLELRDTGEHGFVLPPDSILPTSKETIKGILYLLKAKKNRNGLTREPLSQSIPLNNNLRIRHNYILLVVLLAVVFCIV